MFIPTDKNLPWYELLLRCSCLLLCFAYQGIEHQRIKGVTVGVLHHDVEESIQGVLQKLE